MEKIFSVLLLLLLAHIVSAQDYLVKKNGEEFYCKVKEINSTEVIYTDTTFSASVIRTIKKSDVLFIKYQNGIKEMFNEEAQKDNNTVKTVPVNPSTGLKLEGPIIDLGSNDYSVNGQLYHFKQVRRLMLSIEDPEIERLLMTAKLEGVFGNILAYSSIPMGYIGFALGVNSINDNVNGEASAVAGITLGALCLSSNAANIYFKINKRKKIQQAISIYNRRVEELSQNK